MRLKTEPTGKLRSFPSLSPVPLYMNMDSSFRPLLAFVKLAVRPLLGLPATPFSSSGGAAFNGVSAARYPFETARDRHQLAPEGRMAFVQTAWNPAHEPFEPRPVFEVAFIDAYSYVWVAKNSHARSMPPPPDRSGPVQCVCVPPLHIRDAPRFVSETGGSSWFCPDVHSDRAPARAFAPDLFAGAGDWAEINPLENCANSPQFAVQLQREPATANDHHHREHALDCDSSSR